GVEIELDASGQTEFHLIHGPRLGMAIAIGDRAEPVLEFDLPFWNDVYARLAEQPVSGPSRLFVIADAIVFAKRRFAEYVDWRHVVRVWAFFGLLLTRLVVGLRLRGRVDDLIRIDLLASRCVRAQD